jgi:hypothetical protein
MFWTKPHSLIAAVLAVSATTGLAHSPAHAQQIMIQEARIGSGGDNSFEPSTSTAQMKRLAQVLDLNETQSMLADEFLREYHRLFREKADSVRAEMNEIQEEARATGDFSVFGEKIGPLMEQWGRDRTTLEKEMIDNLRSLLTEEQVERWPLFEREKRRMEMLPDSRLGGENVDVILLTQEVLAEKEIPGEMAEVLEQYAVELDAALQARKRTIDSLQEEWMEALGGERDRMEDIWEEATRKREAVRDVNERVAKLIAEMLRQSDESSGEGDQLWRLYQERAYPMAFEETRAERMLDGATGLEGLAEDTRSTLEGIRSELERRLDPLAHRLITELVKEEHELPPFVQNIQVEGGGRQGRAIGFTMTMGGGGEDDPTAELLRERWDASEAAVEQIKGLLSPEQVQSLQGREEPAGAQRVMLRGLRFNL